MKLKSCCFRPENLPRHSGRHCSGLSVMPNPKHFALAPARSLIHDPVSPLPGPLASKLEWVLHSGGHHSHIAPTPGTSAAHMSVNHLVGSSQHQQKVLLVC